MAKPPYASRFLVNEAVAHSSLGGRVRAAAQRSDSLSERIAEEYGGFLMSLAIFAMVFTWLFARQIEFPYIPPKGGDAGMLTLTFAPAQLADLVPPTAPEPVEEAPAEEIPEEPPPEIDQDEPVPLVEEAAATTTDPVEEAPEEVQEETAESLLDEMFPPEEVPVPEQPVPQPPVETLPEPLPEPMPEPVEQPTETAVEEPFDWEAALDEVVTAPDEPVEVPQEELNPNLPAEVAPPPKPEPESIANANAIQKPTELKLTDREIAELAEIRAALRQEIEEMDSAFNDVRNDAQEQIIKSAGRASFLNSAGVEDGVVRTMELEGVSKPLLQRILKRNGIEMSRRTIHQPIRNKSPINAARTNGQTYKSEAIVGPGTYNFIEFTPKGRQKLAELELKWLANHGLSPDRITFTSIVYGIERIGKGGYWDLAVIEAEYRLLD